MSFDARPDRGIHVATIAHKGRIWDAFLEFDGDPHRPEVYRARLRFEPTNPSDGETATTTGVLIIEGSYDEALAKARSFDDRELSGLLRSALPDAD
jgi:hypothetical protein